MNPLASIRHKLISLKYKRNDLRIIECIPAETFKQIIERYCEEGWELTDSYKPFDSAQLKWHCKLRKGSSVLRCCWNHEHAGSVSGLSRIIKAMGAQFSLTARDAPSR